MRCFALALAMVAGLNCASMAAEQMSPQVLADMGLGAMVVVSDSEAMSVRGFGYSPVRVAGLGWASVKFKGASAGSTNSYQASGKHKAWGSNESEAGVKVSKGYHKTSITAFSGGGSRAGRK
jgi:hypothetical protein